MRFAVFVIFHCVILVFKLRLIIVFIITVVALDARVWELLLHEGF
jgi:hypothetical protein